MPPRTRLLSVMAVLALAVILNVAVAAQAQSVSYELQFFAQGVDPVNGAPTQVQALTVTCAPPSGPPAPDPGFVTNPTQVAFEPQDGPSSGLVCTAPISAFPIGRYVATVTQAQDGATSDRSAASNPFGQGPRPPMRVRVWRPSS